MTDWPASKIVNKYPDALRPNPLNSNHHPPEQVEDLCSSILQFGWTIPLLIDEQDMIIAGEGRWQAVTKMIAEGRLTRRKVPCIVAKGWSEAQIRAYIIADNKLNQGSEFDVTALEREFSFLKEADFDLNVTGFSEDEIDSILSPETQERAGGGVPDPDKYSEQFGVIVICNDEVHQGEVYDLLQEQGYNVKVVTT